MAGALTGSVHSAILSSQVHGRSRACSRLQSRVNFAPRLRSRFVVKAQGETNDEISDLTGEWPANWSLASYEDVGAFFQDNLFKDDTSPGTHLSDVMSITLTTVTADTSIEQAKVLFRSVTGLPVVKSATDKTLVGVVSKKDLNKPGTTVKDIMSTPPIAARPTNKVAEAACLMLKHKVHRIPVVDNQAQVVGIVTRTDIFTAMAMEAGNTELLTNA